MLICALSRSLSLSFDVYGKATLFLNVYIHIYTSLLQHSCRMYMLRLHWYNCLMLKNPLLGRQEGNGKKNVYIALCDATFIQLISLFTTAERKFLLLSLFRPPWISDWKSQVRFLSTGSWIRSIPPTFLHFYFCLFFHIGLYVVYFSPSFPSEKFPSKRSWP